MKKFLNLKRHGFKFIKQRKIYYENEWNGKVYRNLFILHFYWNDLLKLYLVYSHKKYPDTNDSYARWEIFSYKKCGKYFINNYNPNAFWNQSDYHRVEFQGDLKDVLAKI